MRKFNSVFAGLVFAVFALFLAVDGADAFCVYNKTDTQIAVEQTHGHKMFRGFAKVINPGGKECCNWQNEDCNKEGKEDSTVRFNVSNYNKQRESLCKNFPIKAGGDMRVEGSNGKYRCD